ncbi:GlxA family transcriptional regulator [Kitasatospora purpeofusca]|uniref:GlxA family transcriptional regulator n=1 Tax=Kitasatospora purpeofusca TaxID=67352 RepID=UPI002A5A81E0|nr:GlxA family transcriptional regulator [Kitasatospora purpeofusca]MDY0811075.1 GlxA family transcriptional regulator [Kitasatospora purpeofusca]
MTKVRDVLFILFDGVVGLDVAGPLEVLAAANAYRAGRPPATPDGAAYRIRTASPQGRAVRTSSGLTLSPDLDLYAAPVPHTVLVPGGSTTPDGSLVLDVDVVAWLRANAPRCRRTASVCTGAFLLAEAGLLDGRRATTHWSRTAELATRHPAVRVEDQPIFARDGRIWTSAGVTSGIDLTLALVEDDLGRDASLTIARHLVLFLRRHGNQQQFSTQLRAQTAERPGLREIQQWIADHPDSDLSVDALAHRASMSPRHFTRAFTAETGVPPGRYVDRTRLETARHLLEDSTDSIDHIAHRAGYPSQEAMRRAFHRTLGLSPLQYRTQAGHSPAPH